MIPFDRHDHGGNLVAHAINMDHDWIATGQSTED